MENRWLWPFELKEKIGQGGMGVVYRARYVKNDREVAVKLLPPEIAADKKIAIRFERELEVLKKLKHPNIVYCFGGKCEGDQHFYAMELVEGGSLERLLKKRGRLPWEQVVEYSLQLCSALHFAHDHGFIHRDVKPGNLLLTNTGKLKLSDFGLARARTEARLTEHGKTMGTFHYMAPEQIRGKPPLSPQTDLYAMGCVMYEMLAGRPPFRGHAPAEILQKHLEKPPPPVSANAMDCPVKLEILIQGLLQKDPNKRPANAIEVARELKQVTQSTSLDATTRELAVRNTQAAQAVQDAMYSYDSGVTQRRNYNSWLLYGLVLSMTIMTFMLSWNLYVLRGTQSSGRAGELWVEALKDPRPEVRKIAAESLGEIGATSEGSVDALIKGISDPNPEIRRSAVRALGSIGAQAKHSKFDLEQAHKADKDPVVRREAKAAIETILNAEEVGSSLPEWFFYVAGFFAFVAVICTVVFRRIVREMRA